MAALLFTMCFLNNINGNKHTKHGIFHGTESGNGKDRVKNMGKNDMIQDRETSPNMASRMTGNFTSLTVFPDTIRSNVNPLLKVGNTKRKHRKSALRLRERLPTLPISNKGLGDSTFHNASSSKDKTNKHYGVEQTKGLSENMNKGHNADLDSRHFYLNNQVSQYVSKRKKRSVKRINIPLPFSIFKEDEHEPTFSVWPYKMRHRLRKSFKHLPPLA